jgi:hypothetical protein
MEKESMMHNEDVITRVFDAHFTTDVNACAEIVKINEVRFPLKDMRDFIARKLQEKSARTGGSPVQIAQVETWMKIHLSYAEKSRAEPLFPSKCRGETVEHTYLGQYYYVKAQLNKIGAGEQKHCNKYMYGVVFKNVRQNGNHYVVMDNEGNQQQQHG